MDLLPQVITYRRFWAGISLPVRDTPVIACSKVTRCFKLWYLYFAMGQVCLVPTIRPCRPRAARMYRAALFRGVRLA